MFPPQPSLFSVSLSLCPVVSCQLSSHIYSYLHICISSGCDNFHDGLVCWPRTLAGSTAEVDCLENPAVAVALDSVGKIILYLYPVESS